MHVLFLSQIVPWPPDAGPKVKTWHVLQHLKEQGHEITLAAFARPEEEAHIAALRRVCSAVHTVPIHRSMVNNLRYYLRSLFSGRPFLVERDDLGGMRRLVRDILNAEEIDVIHADQLTMAQFAFSSAYPSQEADGAGRRTKGEGASGQPARPYRVFDAHNAVWTVAERMQQTVPWFLKPALSLETRRIRRYEGEVVRRFDHTFVVTEADAAALREVAGLPPGELKAPLNQISVIPIAIDVEQLKPVTRKPGSTNILTVGTLHYPPNADGIRWFAQKVFPIVLQKIPEACLTIVGKNPPKDFLHMASADPQHLQVAGYVEDLGPYFEEAAAMVVPVRAGGGMRVRILESFARGIPTVTTTVGLEGIEAEPGKDVLVEDTPDDLAGAVIRLLKDEGLQARLAANGRKLAETRYDFRVVLQELDRVYHSIRERPYTI